VQLPPPLAALTDVTRSVCMPAEPAIDPEVDPVADPAVLPVAPAPVAVLPAPVEVLPAPVDAPDAAVRSLPRLLTVPVISTRLPTYCCRLDVSPLS
jgi:hypothetical protein